MSETPQRDPIDLEAILAQLARNRAETEKLQGETQKFVAEQRKLLAEARKLDRDRWLAPSLAVAGLLGGIATILLTVARALKWLP